MLKMRTLVASLCCTLMLVACGEESAIKDVVRERLKDPDSAKFGKITVVDTGKTNGHGGKIRVACVTVNAKNSMGGYGGNKQATVVTMDEKWEVGGTFLEVSHESCVDSIPRQ